MRKYVNQIFFLPLYGLPPLAEFLLALGILVLGGCLLRTFSYFIDSGFSIYTLGIFSFEIIFISSSSSFKATLIVSYNF